MRKLPIVTNSSAQDYRTCARMYQLKHELLIRPIKTADTLRFGSMFHIGLEWWWIVAWWIGAPQWLRLRAALRGMRAVNADPFDLVRAEELMRGYHFRWIDEDVRPIAIEAEFVAPLVNPQSGAESRTWLLSGKIDAIARAGDRTVNVEHKTTSEDISLGSFYWKRLRIDAQVSTYFVGAKTLGVDTRECLYDVIRKPDMRPYQATPAEARRYTKPTKNDPVPRLYANQREADETPEEFRKRLRVHIAENPERYYARQTVVRLDRDAEDAAYDLWSTAKAIRDSQLADRWPRNPGACIRYGRECEYFKLCSGEASIDDVSLYRRAERQHEELSAA